MAKNQVRKGSLMLSSSVLAVSDVWRLSRKTGRACGCRGQRVSDPSPRNLGAGPGRPTLRYESPRALGLGAAKLEEPAQGHALLELDSVHGHRWTRVNCQGSAYAASGS